MIHDDCEEMSGCLQISRLLLLDSQPTKTTGFVTAGPPADTPAEIAQSTEKTARFRQRSAAQVLDSFQKPSTLKF